MDRAGSAPDESGRFALPGSPWRVGKAPRAVGWVMAAAFVVYLVWVLWDTLERNQIRDVLLTDVIELLAVAFVVLRVATRWEDRWAWALLAVGITFWVAGDIYYYGWINNLDPQPAWSAADILYLLFYPCLLVAILLIVLRSVGRPPAALGLDAAIVAVGIAAVMSVVLKDVFDQAKGETLDATIVNTAYPVLDLVTLCVLAAVLAMLGWRLERMWYLLAAGCALLTVLDVQYLMGVTDGDLRPELMLDVGWVVALLVLAAAAWVRPAGRLPVSYGYRVVLIPSTMIVIVVALLVAGNFWPIPVESTLLATAVLVIAGIRMIGSMQSLSVAAATRRHAQTDMLTGMGNRRLLYLRLDDAIADLRSNEECGLLLLNLDGFRQVNESFGHAAGDDLLRTAASRIAMNVGRDDTVARIGGDEFALVRVGPAGRAWSRGLARSVVRTMREPVQIGGTTVEVGLRVGIAICPDHAFTREGLIGAAYAALARAKRTHSSVVAYDSELDAEDRGGLRMIQQLREGLRRGELICHYQPKLDLRDGQVHAVEALVRWRNPSEGLIYPDVFLPLAEKGDLMGALTRAVLANAVDQVALWRRSGLDIRVAVNLSMTNLLDPELPDDVERMLLGEGVSADSLVLEVTETVFMADTALARSVLARLHGLGFEISIDDFGKGYSSLMQLRSLDADEIKLDASFVTGVADNPQLAVIVASTAEMAHELGLRLVAEGVETESDLAEVTRLGCDVAQGYFIRRPAPPDEITQWLRRRIDDGDGDPAVPVIPAPSRRAEDRRSV